ncbi:MAG: ExbD/TolR family protein [Planctomycetaceae bacterium]
MRIPSRFQRSDISENMLTPMIDVVFNLLIFFVVASALNVQELVLKADLANEGQVPHAQAAPLTEPDLPLDEVRIDLDEGSDGRTTMRLNGTTYTAFPELREVLRELANIAPESPVTLRIAPSVTAGELLRVYDTCREAGFVSIQFATGSGPAEETS